MKLNYEVGDVIQYVNEVKPMQIITQRDPQIYGPNSYDVLYLIPTGYSFDGRLLEPNPSKSYSSLLFDLRSWFGW